MSLFKNPNKQIKQQNTKKNKNKSVFRTIKPLLASLMTGASLFVACETTYMNNSVSVYNEPKYPNKRIALESLDTNSQLKNYIGKYIVIGRKEATIKLDANTNVWPVIVGTEFDDPANTIIKMFGEYTSVSLEQILNISRYSFQYKDFELDQSQVALLSYTPDQKNIIVYNPYLLVEKDSLTKSLIGYYDMQAKKIKEDTASIKIDDVFRGEKGLKIAKKSEVWFDSIQNFKVIDVWKKAEDIKAKISITYAYPAETGMKYSTRTVDYNGAKQDYLLDFDGVKMQISLLLKQNSQTNKALFEVGFTKNNKETKFNTIFQDLQNGNYYAVSNYGGFDKGGYVKITIEEIKR